MCPEPRRPCAGPAPLPAKRLCAAVVLSVGVACVLAGYMLGRTARGEVRRPGDVVPLSLALAAESLYRKSKRIPPKAMHHNGSEKVAARILEAFRCGPSECGAMAGYDLAELVRACIASQTNKLLRSITNASVYLDSLR